VTRRYAPNFDEDRQEGGQLRPRPLYIENISKLQMVTKLPWLGEKIRPRENPQSNFPD
jgi:hypothetical protein